MNSSGTPDIASEFWVKAVKPQLDTAISAGRLVKGAEILADGAVEGWYIPKFIADANPDILSVQDALKHPELFPDTYHPSLAAIYNCPEAWACEISTSNLFKALGADKLGFALIDSPTPADFDNSIARAFKNKVGWLGYYWSPTSVLGKYDMAVTRLPVTTGSGALAGAVARAVSRVGAAAFGVTGASSSSSSLATISIGAGRMPFLRSARAT